MRDQPDRDACSINAQDSQERKLSIASTASRRRIKEVLNCSSDDTFSCLSQDEFDHQNAQRDSIEKPTALFAQGDDGHFVFAAQHDSHEEAGVDMLDFLVELENEMTMNNGVSDCNSDSVIEDALSFTSNASQDATSHSTAHSPTSNNKQRTNSKSNKKNASSLLIPSMASGGSDKSLASVSSGGSTGSESPKRRTAKSSLNQIVLRATKRRNASLPTICSSQTEIFHTVPEGKISAPNSPATRLSSTHKDVYQTVKRSIRRPSVMMENKPNSVIVTSMPSLLEMSIEDTATDCQIETTVTDEVELRVNHTTGIEVVLSATPSQLVTRVTTCNLDVELMHVFILTFRHVMTPVQLVHLLIERFKSQNDLPFEEAFPIQMRVINFVIKWMDESWFDFHECEEMVEPINELLVMANGDPFTNLRKKLDSVRDNQENLWNEMVETHRIAYNALQLERPKSDPPFSIMDVSANKLAQELIMIDSRLYQKIRRPEVLAHLWCAKHKHANEFTYNLNTYIAWFNKISVIVASEICGCNDMKQRAIIIERIILVAKKCRKYNCYNTLYGVLSGLNHGAVSRLKKTWETVPSKVQACLRDLEQLMAPTQNFLAYRGALKESRVPVIPVMGIVLKDHTFLNEIPKRKQSGLVNLFKLRAIKSHLDIMEVFQRAAVYYSFEVDETLQNSLLYMPVEQEKGLYELSLVHEPRIPKKASLTSEGSS